MYVQCVRIRPIKAWCKHPVYSHVIAASCLLVQSSALKDKTLCRANSSGEFTLFLSYKPLSFLWLISPRGTFLKFWKFLWFTSNEWLLFVYDLCVLFIVTVQTACLPTPVVCVHCIPVCVHGI